jgi:hypothetical protein
MMGIFKELYLTGFTLVFRFFRKGSTPSRSGQAAGILMLIEWVVLVAIWDCIEMLLGKRDLIGLSKPAIVIITFALYLMNLYVLYFRGYGINYERGFNSLKKSKRFVLVAGCAALLVASIAFYIFSLIAHRHFIGADAP